MSWIKLDDSGERWTWEADDVRHLLVLAGEELREYHEVPDGPPTVHVYTASTAFGTSDEPLGGAQWVATYMVPAEHAPWVRALDDRELIEWLIAGGYVS